MSSDRNSSSSSGHHDKDEEAVPDISSPDVVAKYKESARIVNDALQFVTKQCIPGASVYEICLKGDEYILNATRQLYKKSQIKKGIGFPVCVSINNVVGHLSPLKKNDITLAAGDLVKIEFGAHINGFISLVGHTIIVKENEDEIITGRRADVILATHYCLEAAIRMCKVGIKTQEMASTLEKIASAFECSLIENTLMYSLSQHRIEGEKSILLNGTKDAKKDHTQPEIEEFDVYALDVLMTTGKGKVRPTEFDTTVYKFEDTHYSLKQKRSRHFFSYASQAFGLLPFTLRHFEKDAQNVQQPIQSKAKGDSKQVEMPDFVSAKFGLKECREHMLASPFDVTQAENGEFVAQFKSTVLVFEKGPERITTYLPYLDLSKVKSEHSIKDETILKLLSEELEVKKKKKKKNASKAQVNSTEQQV